MAKKVEISAPDGKTLVLNVPDNATPEQIRDFAIRAKNDYQLKQEPAKNTITSQLLKSPVLPAGGGFVGSLVGGPMGAAMGGGAGEAARQLSARLGRSMGVQGLDEAIPATSTEALNRIKDNAAYQGIADLAAAGLGTGVKAVAKAAKPALRMAGRAMANYGEAITGVQKKAFVDLFNNPSLLAKSLPNRVAELGAAVGREKSAIGAERTILDVLNGNEKEEVKSVINSLLGGARIVKSAGADLVKQGENAVTTGQIARVNKTLGDLARAATDAEDKVLLQRAHKVFQGLVEKTAPELAEANAEFTVKRGVSDFFNLGRLNKTGRPSTVHTVLSILRPEFLLTSPAVFGAGTAALGLGAKTLGSQNTYRLGGQLGMAYALDSLRKRKKKAN